MKKLYVLKLVPIKTSTHQWKNKNKYSAQNMATQKLFFQKSVFIAEK